MSIRKWLGLAEPASTAPDEDVGDTRTVRRIVSRLERMDPEQARHIAAFAYILGRVANADLEISVEETREMERLVQLHGNLSEDQAILVVQIAKSQNKLLGSTEDFLVTREFKRLSTEEQRRHLLDCLFAVSAADDTISSVEEVLVRQVANELGLSHEEYVTARAAYSEKRAVIKLLRESSTSEEVRE